MSGYVSGLPVFPNIGDGPLLPDPVLTGLTYDIIKRPIHYIAEAKSGSGWSVRVAYAEWPTWEWDLTYDLLADASATSDLKVLLGFYLAMGGSLTPFLFMDPDDCQVTGSLIGTGDGTKTTWPIVRSYGSATYGARGSEPVGYIFAGAPVNVYLDSTLQSSGYSVSTTNPMNQQLIFASAPAAGQQITMDCGFYFWVHFKAGDFELNKFMHQGWGMKKLTLESLRG